MLSVRILLLVALVLASVDVWARRNGKRYRRKWLKRFPRPHSWMHYSSNYDPAVEENGCIDIRPECNKWALFPGYCGYAREYMIRHCKKSCKLCKQEDAASIGKTSGVVIPNEVCEDRLEDCRTYIKSQSQCSLFSGLMKKYCARTCGFCCFDILTDCSLFIRRPSQCRGLNGFFRKYCPNTCQMCGFLLPLKETGCQDELDDCKLFSLEQCQVHKSFYSKYCAKTCGFCEGYSPEGFTQPFIHQKLTDQTTVKKITRETSLTAKNATEEPGEPQGTLAAGTVTTPADSTLSSQTTKIPNKATLVSDSRKPETSTSSSAPPQTTELRTTSTVPTKAVKAPSTAFKTSTSGNHTTNASIESTKPLKIRTRAFEETTTAQAHAVPANDTTLVTEISRSSPETSTSKAKPDVVISTTSTAKTGTVDSIPEAPTTIPDTEAPTTIPDTKAPTTLPDTEAPTTLPDTEAPTTLPDTEAPTTLPDTEAPTTLPEAPTTISDTDAPTSIPNTEAPTTIPEAPNTIPDTEIPTTIPDTEAPTTLPDTKAPTTIPDTEAPTTLPDTEAPTTLPDTEAPTTLPDTEAPTTLPDTEAPTTLPDTEAPTTLPDTEAPTTIPDTEAPTTIPDADAPTNIPDTEAPTTLPDTEAPTTLPDTETPVTLPDTEAPTTIPDTEAPTTIPDTEAPTTIPDADAPTNIPDTEAPTTLPDTEAPTTLPDTETPTTLPDTEAPTTIPDADAPTNIPDTEAPTNIPDTDANELTPTKQNTKNRSPTPLKTVTKNTEDSITITENPDVQDSGFNHDTPTTVALNIKEQDIDAAVPTSAVPTTVRSNLRSKTKESGQTGKRAVCVDKLKECASYVNENINYCKYHVHFMHDYCSKSCGFCVQETAGPPTKQTTGKSAKVLPKCEDRRRKKCQYFSKYVGYCTVNRKYMRKMCPLSCGFCAVAPGSPPLDKTFVRTHQKYELAIRTNWDGTPIRHAPIKFQLSAEDNTNVRLEVSGPLFNQPGPPPCVAGQPCWQLWNYEVAEVFFLGEKEKYLELEVSPHGPHLLLLLDGVRKPFKTKLPMRYSATKDLNTMTWNGTAIIPIDYFPPGMRKINAYAIHGPDYKKSYESLYPAIKTAYPDFHRLEFFKDFDFKSMFPSGWNQPISPLWLRTK